MKTLTSWLFGVGNPIAIFVRLDAAGAAVTATAAVGAATAAVAAGAGGAAAGGAAVGAGAAAGVHAASIAAELPSPSMRKKPRRLVVAVMSSLNSPDAAVIVRTIAKPAARIASGSG